MVLIFITPSQNPPHYFFNVIPARAFINCFLFLGLVHLWITALKKQLKSEKIRRNTFKVVLSISIVIAILVESIQFLFLADLFNIWNLIFEIIGSFLGIVTFKLLYRTCY